MPILFYEYATCSTCKKAKKWLESHKIEFEVIPIVENPPSAKEIKSFYEASGLDIKKFFNTSGVSYRTLGLSSKINSLSDSECLKLLASDGKLIKRPLLVKIIGNKSQVLLGFNENDYKKLLG